MSPPDEGKKPQKGCKAAGDRGAASCGLSQPLLRAIEGRHRPEEAHGSKVAPVFGADAEAQSRWFEVEIVRFRCDWLQGAIWG